MSDRRLDNPAQHRRFGNGPVRGSASAATDQRSLGRRIRWDDGAVSASHMQHMGGGGGGGGGTLLPVAGQSRWNATLSTPGVHKRVSVAPNSVMSWNNGLARKRSANESTEQPCESRGCTRSAFENNEQSIAPERRARYEIGRGGRCAPGLVPRTRHADEPGPVGGRIPSVAE